VSFDGDLLRTGLRTIHDKLSPDEASAIFDVARLAAAADKKTDIGEMAVLIEIARIVYEMADVTDLPIPSLGIDQSRLLAIGEQLVPTGPRELAFACAFLVMIQDQVLAAEEGQLAGRLSEALMITPTRANQLALAMDTLARSARRA
jgi:hypothetical protein